MKCPRCGNSKIISARQWRLSRIGRECVKCRLIWVTSIKGIDCYWFNGDVSRVPEGSLPIFKESVE